VGEALGENFKKVTRNSAPTPPRRYAAAHTGLLGLYGPNLRRYSAELIKALTISARMKREVPAKGWRRL
jgi:hypothetical protein